MRREQTGFNAWRAVIVLAAATLASVGVPRIARGVLGTPGFRAVGVAHSAYPISSMAVAPDGRLFAAIQALGPAASPTTPGTAEIRVYSAYALADGSKADEGAVWATVSNMRATNVEEGLLGIALAPDFATSKLVYVYATTTDESVNQHILVFRENATGTGDYLGTVASSIEPPTDSTTRHGAPLAFGVDGCLYVGVGDNGNTHRWNAQLLLGTDPIQGAENGPLCTNICLGPTLYPSRAVTNNGAPNQAGKVLRLAVEGASTAQPGPGGPLASQPYLFGAGLRNPVGFGINPLTGQLYVAERGDTLEAEIDVVDSGSNGGWPCLDGSQAAGVSGCIATAGKTAADVYANHPEWRRPIATHTGNPVVSGIAAYTGLGYPEQFYGDVFYLLRDSARIYRIDLAPPCFLPNPNGITPIAFHDSGNDNDFVVNLDIDGDGDYENVAFPNMMSIVQAPNPLGQQVLYIAGKQGNASLNDDSIIFRIEYATALVPYAGPTGRVPDSCFSDGVYSGGGGAGAALYGYENPFRRSTCLPPGGPCPGAPDGSPCSDGDACNGAESCTAGVCRHGAPLADGTTCDSPQPCLGEGTCSSGFCVGGAQMPDGTPCPDADPCNGLEVCSGGVCQAAGGPAPLSVRSLTVKRGPGSLVLSGSFRPAVTVAPESRDNVALELSDGSGPLFTSALDHPGSDPRWKRRNGTIQYADKAGQASGLTSMRLRPQRSGLVQLEIKGRRMPFAALDDAAISPRLIIGDQCFTASLAGSCALSPKKLRCKP